MSLENLAGNSDKKNLSREEQEFLLAYCAAWIAWMPIREGLNKVYDDIGKMFSDFEKRYNKERYLNQKK